MQAEATTIKEYTFFYSFLVNAFKLRGEIFTQIKHSRSLKLARCWEQVLHT